MRCVKILAMLLLIALCGSPFLPLSEGAEGIPHPSTYVPSLQDFMKHKKQYDDPRPFLTEWGPKQILPPELYQKLTFDITQMKEKWAEVVGFRSPDVVGKIAPEIQPGKYTYKDLEKYPGFKELMWPNLYNRIKPGGPPFAGNIPEFEVVPTKQYYYSQPIAECTRANEGKTKLDENGYLRVETWEGGLPFPKPSGEFKGQQIIYNLEKRVSDWELNIYVLGWNYGYTKDFRSDLEAPHCVNRMRLAGRCLLPPYGWFDARARERQENNSFVMTFLGPRDIAGAAQQAIQYLSPVEMDQNLMFLPSLRRIRKMSATDTQDPIMGSDMIYDDNSGFTQKLSPTRYPYKYEVLEEREYLCPAYTWDGSEYVTSPSQGLEFRNLKFERRPVYVVKLTQLDPNYVYGARIFYIDKETFYYLSIENYDRKGRLYRTVEGTASFFPEMGMIAWGGAPLLMTDHIDLHSSWNQSLELPAVWTREDVNLGGLLKKSK
jgi:hypothetical protein